MIDFEDGGQRHADGEQGLEDPRQVGLDLARVQLQLPDEEICGNEQLSHTSRFGLQRRRYIKNRPT